MLQQVHSRNIKLRRSEVGSFRSRLTDRRAVGSRLEAVLLQNTYLNIVEDELQKLGDDDGPAPGQVKKVRCSACMLAKATAWVPTCQYLCSLERKSWRRLNWLPPCCYMSTTLNSGLAAGAWRGDAGGAAVVRGPDAQPRARRHRHPVAAAAQGAPAPAQSQHMLAFAECHSTLNTQLDGCHEYFHASAVPGHSRGFCSY